MRSSRFGWHGLVALALAACVAPVDTSDTNPSVPDDTAPTCVAGPEVCNDRDDDCDGEVDELPTDGTSYFADLDQDGWGELGASVAACAAPAGYVDRGGDCDDDDPARNPGVIEADCTDPIDYNCDGEVGYADADDDGYAACKDCNDADKGVNPSAAELCNGVDDDCDGDVDIDATDAVPWYADTDGDGFGDVAAVVSACGQPTDHVANDEDCDDTRVAVSPAGVETCNDLDDDCDGGVDDDATDVTSWYADSDGDGFGDAAAIIEACVQPADYVGNDDDCDDATAAVSPSADETCNGSDDDCDGAVDVGAADVTSWYADTDGDGFGDATAVVAACDLPTGHAANDDDCDDTKATSSPSGVETCNGEDDDCDGVVDDGAADAPVWYTDLDTDGYGASGVTTKACGAPPFHVATAGDCDDAKADVHPTAPEFCGGVDYDCDAATNEDTSVDAKSWYVDGDGDLYGAGVATVACLQPGGQINTSGDCDDGNGAVHPNAAEVCNGGIDDDCNSGTVESCEKRVFVTSTLHTGNLGGLAGADAICQARATAAGLSGTYLAWLSTPTQSPATRFARSTGPYVLVTGTKIANSWTDMTDGALIAPINRTELGTVPPAGDSRICGGTTTVWSATAANGGIHNGSLSCSSWTSSAGAAHWGDWSKVNGWWSAWCTNGGGGCNWTSSLYCFEQ